MASDLPENEVFQGFTLLDFKTIDYRELLYSQTGSEIIMAILADFQGKSPEMMIRLILRRLMEVCNKVKELEKFFNQLNILSRLRNLNEETVKIITEMPITIDFDKDYLYNKGIAKGLEKGLNEGEAKKNKEATINMLEMGFDHATICQVLGVTKEYVIEIEKALKR